LTEWIKRSIDLNIVMISASLAYWIFLIGPIFGIDSTTPFIEKFLAAAYPVGDLFLLFSILIIIYYRSEKLILGSIILLGSGTAMMIATDTFYGYQSSVGSYVSGGLVDLGWNFAFILMFYAGLYQAVASKYYKEDSARANQNLLPVQKGISQVLPFAPYLWVAGAYYLLKSDHHFESIINSEILFLSVGLIIGLVVIRQILTLNENKYLLSSLKTLLEKENTHVLELNKINRSLQVEMIERKRVEIQLSHDALHDGLTGLANRVLFMDHLDHAVKMTKRDQENNYSILFIDIDNFKSINDGQGHTAGDKVLIELSARLINCTRSTDTVARFGGDEFAILLEHTREKNISITVANRILKEIQQPFLINGYEILTSCSIGIVKEISDYIDTENILRDVDIALYKAKEKGKGQYKTFTLEMRAKAMSRLEVEADLRRAINIGEFYLAYQPICSLEGNNIGGVEALIRWRHPLRGVVMPNDFIHIAEESGMIVQIGDWVLLEACTQLKKWHQDYPDLENLCMSVNISGNQINQVDFIEKVKETLLATALNPQRLILEITENAFIENQSLINKLLEELREIGVSFAIDDFGTGYSALSYLQNLSVDTIKIDKSFIDRIADNKKGFEIVKTIILLAKEMGMKTVAEGIETGEQLEKLKTLMCSSGQGYLLSKPVDALIIESILQNQGKIELI
jgi:diguanylate cyclase (GGDEF)-like protein